MCGRYFLERDISDAALLRILETLEAREEGAKSAATSSPPTARRRWRTGAYFPCAGALRAPRRRAVINARSETAQEKAMFRGAGRCLLPASGYYEWGGEQKRRYAFARPGGAIYMAGLWRREADGEKRFVILTREATAEAARVHARMPVLFDGELRRAWLDARNPLPELLRAAVDDVSIVEREP